MQDSRGYNLIPIFMLASIFYIVIVLYIFIYQAKKKTGVVAKTTIAAAAINIIILLLGIKFIGLYAASVSSLVAYMVMCIYRYFDVKKYVNAPIEKEILISCIFAFSIILFAYYSGSKLFQMSALIIAIIFAGLINRKTLATTVKTIKCKLA